MTARSTLFLCFFLVGFCLLSVAPPATAEIQATTKVLEAKVDDVHYFRGTANVIVQDEDNGFWFSNNEGTAWSQISLSDEGFYLMHNDFFPNNAFILGYELIHWRTKDSGATFTEVTVPLPSASPVFQFHPDLQDYVIFHGQRCESSSVDCPVDAYYSTDGGDHWTLLRQDVVRCIWGLTKDFRAVQRDTIFCVVYEDDVAQLARTDNYFVSSRIIMDSYVYGLAFDGKFLILATENLQGHCPDVQNCGSLHTSIDGSTFTLAKLPASLAPNQHGYTLLSSLSGSLTLEITTDADQRWGAVASSDSTGTYFVNLLDKLDLNNRNPSLKRLDALPGFILANIVSNPEQVKLGLPKQILTLLSYDDGSSWNSLAPPSQDLCKHSNECALHLHRRSERTKFISSSGAPGLMMGVGSVGDYLEEYANCNTYLSRDGGKNWKVARAGPHLYEFGDHGALAIMVNDKDPTGHIRYSWDEGITWTQFTFSTDQKIRVTGLETSPDSQSRKFLIHGTQVIESQTEVKGVIVVIDFTGDTVPQCGSSDLETWQPVNATDGGCLLGSKTTYYRRKESTSCYIGSSSLIPSPTSAPCACTARDYECDYGYIRASMEDACALDGPEPTQPPSCTSGSTYTVSSGFRKIPDDACVGGVSYPPLTKTCAAIPGNPDPVPANDTVQAFSSTFQSRLVTYEYFRKSTTVVALDDSGRVFLSNNEGKTWTEKPMQKQIQSIKVSKHDDSTMVFLSRDNLHVMTTDRMVTTRSFTTQSSRSVLRDSIVFHPKNDQMMIYIGTMTDGENYYRQAEYTSNGGITWTRLLTYVDKCYFGVQGTFSSDQNAIYCTEYPQKSGNQASMSRDLSLARSSNQFRDKVVLIEHLIDFVFYEKFLVCVVLNDGGFHLYTSIDGVKFTPARFPAGSDIEENGYALETTSSDAIFVDVFSHDTAGGNMGTLLVSNSDGTTFTVSMTFTNRDSSGETDFEKVPGLRGTLIANTVVNHEVVQIGGNKKIQSRISFNDGGKWVPIVAPAKDYNGNPSICATQGSSCSLHLHSSTERAQPGMTFSSSSSIGLMMGVGNLGDSLTSYDVGNTYLTRDGGVTWREVRLGPHMFEFGDRGAVLVIVNDKDPTDHIRYSWDEGATWTNFVFSPIKMTVRWLTTEPASTSLKFLIYGEVTANSRTEYRTIHIDFSNLHERKCVPSDFENWIPTGAGEECLMGSKITYKRRLQSASCYIDDPDFDHVVSEVNCPCIKDDFECDFDYIPDGDNCVLMEGVIEQPEICEGTYMASSGWQKVPGNACFGGLALNQPVQKTCVKDPVENLPIRHYLTAFNEGVDSFFYFKGSSVIVLLDGLGQVWRSEDDGGHWEKIVFPQTASIAALVLHPYDSQRAYFITTSKSHFLTLDRAKTVQAFTAPLSRSRYIALTDILSFHSQRSDWILFHGDGCEGASGCQHDDAQYSLDNGKTWKRLEIYVQKCVWGRTADFAVTSQETVYCMSHSIKSGLQTSLIYNSADTVRLIKYPTLASAYQTMLTNVAGFFIFNKFLAVGVFENSILELYMSVDGTAISKAIFPPGTVLEKNGYSLLESSTGVAFVDVHTVSTFGKEMGTLIESDSTGYKFSVSLMHTNRDGFAQSDFEKMQGLPGIILSNVVSNHDEVTFGSASKKIKTLISFDDGGEWLTLNPPSTGADGTPITCSASAGCSLHLIGITGRDQRASSSGAFFSSAGAVGLAMGVGNVGTSLGSYAEGNTYLTNDAGLTWTEVRRGPHRFEFGDRGALIVIVNDKDPTDHVRYTWDEGRTWESFKFSDNKMKVYDLVAYEDGTTERFLLLGNFVGDTTDYTLMIDFANLHQSECTSSDFEYWSPVDHLGGICLLGHQTSYQRRKSSSRCSISKPYESPTTKVDHCQCTEEDYECDIEYHRDGSFECTRINGEIEQPVDCIIGSEYRVPSGYRRIPADTCTGGVDLTKPVTKICQDPTQPTAEPTPKPTQQPTQQPTQGPTEPTKTPPTDAPTAKPPGKDSISPGAWAAIILVPILIVVAFAGALIYRKYYGDFRMPKIFQRVRYARLNQDDGGMLLDDY